MKKISSLSEFLEQSCSRGADSCLTSCCRTQQLQRSLCSVTFPPALLSSAGFLAIPQPAPESTQMLSVSLHGLRLCPPAHCSHMNHTGPSTGSSISAQCSFMSTETEVQVEGEHHKLLVDNCCVHLPTILLSSTQTSEAFPAF